MGNKSHGKNSHEICCAIDKHSHQLILLAQPVTVTAVLVRSLPILSRFLEFLTLFLPRFSSGNWKQKFSPPFSPSTWKFVCQCILKTHSPGKFFSHNFIIARLSTLLSQPIVTYSLSLSKHSFAQNICRNTVLRS